MAKNITPVSYSRDWRARCAKSLVLSLLTLHAVTQAIGQADSAQEVSVKHNQSNTVETQYHVSSYGAIGDGITDDSRAVQAAIDAAAKEGKPNPVVEFEAGKTYALKSQVRAPVGGMIASINIIETANITLRGNGARLEVYATAETPLRTLLVLRSENIDIKGFTFAYAPKPFEEVEVESIDLSGKPSMDIVSPVEFDFPGTEWKPGKAFGGSYFGLESSAERLHLFLTGFEKLGGKRYRIGINTTRENSWRERLQRLPGKKFLLPNPTNGHLSISSYMIWRSSNINMIDCEVENAPFFLFSIRYNKGPLSFTRVNIRPRPGSNESMVGWRDGYHCKDNRGPITWTDCIATGLHDDVFNIAATTLQVTESSTQDAGSTKIYMKSSEASSGDLSVGDVISAINPKTGEDLGDATIVKVLSNECVILDRYVPGMNPGVVVAVKSLTAPGSVIRNSYFSGTFRFKGSLTVENTTFDLLKIWFNNEIVLRLSPDRTVSHKTFVEGPLPFDQLYKNCTFNGLIPGAALIANSFMEDPGIPGYKSRNIRFQNCRFNGVSIEIEPGNDLVFE